MKPSRSTVTFGARWPLVLAAIALGAVAVGCGPQKKFCPQSTNGVCPTPMDASGESIYIMDAQEEERGSIYVGQDGGGN
jgi:hypothetical protein